jgi:hypothetical protein
MTMTDTAERIRNGLSYCRVSAASEPGHLTKTKEIIQGTTALLLNEILQELRKMNEENK